MNYNSMTTIAILDHFQPARPINEPELIAQLRAAFDDDERDTAYAVWELATMINDAALMVAETEARRVDVPVKRAAPRWMVAVATPRFWLTFCMVQTVILMIAR